MACLRKKTDPYLSLFFHPHFHSIAYNKGEADNFMTELFFISLQNAVHLVLSSIKSDENRF